MVRRQHGLLLLPVAIALAVMGALAYGMTRQGAMGASAVDAQYDIEAARYLAEAGLRLAKWQNEKIGCGSAQRFSNVRLPGVEGSVSVESIVVDREKFTPVVKAISARGSASSLTRDKMMFFDRSREVALTLPDSALKDTYISSVFPTASYGNSSLLEATDDKAHILLDVSTSNLPARARVMKATLSMYLDSANSVQTVRELAAHALTRSWSDGSATWESPWNTSPGGSYEARPESTTPVPTAGRWYTWDIAALMRRWDSGALGNFGLLFKPAGLNGARFNSINNPSNRPRVELTYHRRCD